MPYKYNPIVSNQSTKTALQTINKNFMMLDAEVNTKTIATGNKKQMVTGQLPNGKYGEVFYDLNGTPRILIGQAPNNGRPGIWITKPGFNVLDEVK